MKAKKKKTAKRGRYNKGDARLVMRLPQMRLTEEDYDRLERARAHRAGRTGKCEQTTEFVRQAIKEAAMRELGKGERWRKR